MSGPRYRMIRHGQVLDIQARCAAAADVLVEDDTIREIGPPGFSGPPDAEVIDATDRLLMPGLINGHVHSHGTLAKGAVEDQWSLELFLNALPSLGGNRNDSDKYLGTVWTAIEMVRKGCTTCYDLFFEFPKPSLAGFEAVAKGYRDVGVRAVLAPMVADHSLYQALPGLLDEIPPALRREVERFNLAPLEATVGAMREIYHSGPFDRNYVHPAIGPTIPLHCSDSFLVQCGELAREYGLPLQTHLAESKTQAVLGLRKYGESLTAHLDRLGVIDERFSAAHGIWLDDDDLQRIADGGGSIVHNPLSNMRVGSGLARLGPMRAHGVNVGIGTDASLASDSLNMYEAIRLASFISRIQSPQYTEWLTADEVFSMGTEGSARALGLHDSIGRLAAGYKADIVFLDLTHVNYVPLNDAVRQVVFSENGAAVDSVMIGGCMVLEQGQLNTVDEASLRADVAEALARLRPLNAPLRALADQIHDVVGRFCVAVCREPHHIHRLA